MMKTEDGGLDDLLPSLPLPPPPPPPPSPHTGAGPSEWTSGPPDAAAHGSASPGAGPATPKRTVCDHCRRRRIRCDGQLPCQPCINASLACKRDHVPLKRGPKRGRGRVINELRERYSIDNSGSSHNHLKHSRESSSDLGTTATASVPSTPPPPSDISWQNVSSDPRHAAEPAGAFSTEQYRPTSRSYLYLMPRCVELYYEHIYPIMPLPYMPAVRALVAGPPPQVAGLSCSDRNFLYALCALTCFHMSGQNITADAPHPSWESAGRFFLDECIAARQSYDFFNDSSLHAVMSSFWLSTSFFEINQSRKSWLYLREALTLAQELALHDDAAYAGLDAAERLCRQRVFWQLFVTERSFAILRSKPITLKKTPSLPTTRHPYEAPEIHSGFLQLIGSYTPLDEAFVNAWNEGSDPGVTATTYLALQNLLAVQPPFLARARAKIASRAHTISTASHTPEGRSPAGNDTTPPFSPPQRPAEGDSSNSPSNGAATTTAATIAAANFSTALSDSIANADVDAVDEEITADHTEPETTDIQKADLLITQQWLRLIVWQSSFRQQLLSWTAPDESMRFVFPLTIASRTAAVIQSLPPQAIEVHGMGIFEKIFEIGTWSMNVLQACDVAGANGMAVAGGGGAPLGMDFASGSDIGVLGVGRMSYAIDPLEFFVRTLSASPNSRTQYAERLLMFANERTGGMRMALSPALSSPSSPELAPMSHWSHDQDSSDADHAARTGHTHTSAGPAAAFNNISIGGSVIGEVVDDYVPPDRGFAAPADQLSSFDVGYDAGGYEGVAYDETISPGSAVDSFGSLQGGLSRNHSFGSFTDELQDPMAAAAAAAAAAAVAPVSAAVSYPTFPPGVAQSPIETGSFFRL